MYVQAVAFIKHAYIMGFFFIATCGFFSDLAKRMV